ncbi:MAG: hypothetical protein QOJ62_500 [Actinomycetota bacterium]|jgi:hypothetical protein|nr:hypothetical protein [Actinomycetota bacterium]
MYVAPEITEIGTVRELTLGGQDGQDLDATFPAGTPRGQLTFS